MSRQNKVNPGMYTQRGRLTQDDAAREMKRQREVGSQHTWQPVQRDQLPHMKSEPASPIEESTEQTPAEVKKAPVRAKARKTAGAKKATTATKRGKAKSAKPARAAKPKAKAAKRRYKS